MHLFHLNIKFRSILDNINDMIMTHSCNKNYKINSYFLFVILCLHTIETIDTISFFRVMRFKSEFNIYKL